jgi:hypothetical protein
LGCLNFLPLRCDRLFPRLDGCLQLALSGCEFLFQLLADAMGHGVSQRDFGSALWA